jgi:hypothetical protein
MQECVKILGKQHPGNKNANMTGLVIRIGCYILILLWVNEEVSD